MGIMGKSSGAKQVNSQITDQYNQLNGQNNPYSKFQDQQNQYLSGLQSQFNPMLGDIMQGYQNFNPNTLLGENKQAIYGNGVFSDYAKTGGLTDQDKQNYIKQATASAPSVFAGIGRQMQNQNTVNHGLNPGYTSQMSALSRDTGKSIQDAQLGAETGLQQLINQGKEFGATGLQHAGEGAQGLQNQGAMMQLQKLSGLSGLYGQGLQAQESGMRNLLQSLGMHQQDINQILQMQSGRNSNTPLWQSMFSNLTGGLGGLLGGILGGKTQSGSPSNAGFITGDTAG